MSTCMPRQRPAHTTTKPSRASRPAATGGLSHVDASGRVRMVDVSAKPRTTRQAVACGRVFMHRDTLQLLRDGATPKGDVLATAHVAGVMAAKRTSEIIPLAH